MNFTGILFLESIPGIPKKGASGTLPQKQPPRLLKNSWASLQKLWGKKIQKIWLLQQQPPHVFLPISQCLNICLSSSLTTFVPRNKKVHYTHCSPMASLTDVFFGNAGTHYWPSLFRLDCRKDFVTWWALSSRERGMETQDTTTNVCPPWRRSWGI